MLDSLEIDAQQEERARTSVHLNGSDLASELIALGLVSEMELAVALSNVLGIAVEPIAPAGTLVETIDRMTGRIVPGLARIVVGNGELRLYLWPRLEDLAATARLLSALPQTRRSARIALPSEMDQALQRSNLSDRFRRASESLSITAPHFSAFRVMRASQISWAVLIVLAVGLSLWSWPQATAAAISWTASLFFILSLVPKLVPALGPSRLTRRAIPAAPLKRRRSGSDPLPVYSILVALHDEAGMAGQLVDALCALDWPVSRLEIKLVCEADDQATIMAFAASIAGRPQFSLVLVPPGNPRTKPKALNFALPLLSGRYVVLYDAEDRPHPGQLREAHRRFSRCDGRIAGFQSPLQIVNAEQNWLTGLFALEYLALFRGYLPFLARYRLPLPLGGTSNHFDREKLLEVGGWDSHNVTEDADLGFRFFRHGYRFETLTLPTLEDAPETIGIWLNQRSRWIKGWMLTWLVHMRHPVRLVREIGCFGTGMFQIVFLGMLASMLAFPLAIVLSAENIAALVLETDHTTGSILPAIVLDGSSFAAAVASFVLLSVRNSSRRERRVCFAHLIYLPIYWLLITVAGLRGMAEILSCPHHWRKTPHDLRSREQRADPRHRTEPTFLSWPPVL